MNVIMFPHKHRDNFFDENIQMLPDYIQAEEAIVTLLAWKWVEEKYNGGWSVAMRFQVIAGQYAGRLINCYRNVKEAYQGGYASCGERSFIYQDYIAIHHESCVRVPVNAFGNKALRVSLKQKRDKTYIDRVLEETGFPSRRSQNINNVHHRWH